MMDDVIQDSDKTAGVRWSGIAKTATEAVCACEYTCAKIHMAWGAF